MFKPEQMSRLLIVASKDQMAPVIAELYSHHIFHIEEFVERGADGYEGFRIGSPLSGASEASGDLVKVRSIASTFSIQSDDSEVKNKSRQSELRKKIEQELPTLEQEVGELTQKRSKIETNVKELEQKIAEIRPFTKVPIDLDLYHGYSQFAVLAGYITHDVTIPVPHEMFISKEKDKNFIVVILPVNYRSEAEKILQGAVFQPVPIPAESGAPQARIDYYSGQISDLKKEHTEIDLKLEAIKEKHADFLVACEEILKAEVDKTEAPLRFATTNQIFVAEGWVPSEKVATISQAMEKVYKWKNFCHRPASEF